jgi:hypothetical protein
MIQQILKKLYHKQLTAKGRNRVRPGGQVKITADKIKLNYA